MLSLNINLLNLRGSGGALVDVGEAMKRLAEVKDSLDIDVKQNFIDPLQGLCDKDLREIQVQFTDHIWSIAWQIEVEVKSCPQSHLLYLKNYIYTPHQHHLKKLEGRRLDYDYKKKRQGKIPDEEVRQALEKFHESKEVAETSMYNLLETDVRTPYFLTCCVGT